jgi:hypothetical protein
MDLGLRLRTPYFKKSSYITTYYYHKRQSAQQTKNYNFVEYK